METEERLKRSATQPFKCLQGSLLTGSIRATQAGGIWSTWFSFQAKHNAWLKPSNNMWWLLGKQDTQTDESSGCRLNVRIPTDPMAHITYLSLCSSLNNIYMLLCMVDSVLIARNGCIRSIEDYSRLRALNYGQCADLHFTSSQKTVTSTHLRILLIS